MHSQVIATILAATVAIQGAVAAPSYQGQQPSYDQNMGYSNGGDYKNDNKNDYKGGYNNEWKNEDKYKTVTVTKTVTAASYCPSSPPQYDTPDKGYQPPTDYKPTTAYDSYPAQKTHYVTVGGPNGKLAYYPDNIQAKKGDIVHFEFLERNHTVTQSSFDVPCTGIDGGFKTGFVPNLEGERPGPMRKFEVVDELPKWFYCGQKQPKPHCGGGNMMVFAINAKDDKQLKEFQQKARDTKV